MLKFLLMPCLLLINVEIKAQNMKKSVAFVREFFADRHPFVYYYSIGQFSLKYLKEAILKDTLYNDFFFKKNNPEQQLILTDHERKYVLQEIAKQTGSVWPENLFPNSSRREYAKVMGVAVGGPRIYSFSQPIFIRENSVCICYYAYYCGMECGQGAVEVYHKIDLKWKRWITMTLWIS